MININGKFKIDADENQFILKEVGTVQDKESRTIECKKCGCIMKKNSSRED